MIHLLPPVCRDCGRGLDQTTLNPYLDFQLCGACIARREREVRDLGGRRARGGAPKTAGRKATPPKGAPRKPSSKKKSSKPKR